MARLTNKAMAQLTAHLEAQSRERLVELLMEQALSDTGLRDRLLIEAATQGRGPLDVASYRQEFADALRAGSAARRNHPRTSAPWAEGVHDVLDHVAALLDAGHAAAVLDITEYALGRIDVAMSRLDDSLGWFIDVTARVEKLHYDACVVSRPDPVALARRLFALEVDSEWDILVQSAKRYEDLLGPDGLAEMRELATDRWAKLPPAGPRDPRSDIDRHAHLSRMFTTLAELSGDVDARVTVMARDLSAPHRYVEIAAVLTEAGRDDEALAWAERGLAAFEDSDHPMRGDARLDDVALAGWEARGRGDDVAGLVWRRFTQRPGLPAYQRLKDWTERVGVWETYQEQALAVLEQRAALVPSAETFSPSGRRFVRPPDAVMTHDDLIAVLAWDGRLDEAWALANEHGASDLVWIRLAEAREATHPLDAARVYAGRVEELIARRQTGTYQQAVDRIAHIATLYERAGDPEGFAVYLAQVRHTHRPKATFLRLLDDAGLGAPILG